MSSPTGSFDLAASFTERGIDLATLGAAYLILIVTAVLTVAAFYAARNSVPSRGILSSAANPASGRTRTSDHEKPSRKSVSGSGM